MQETLELQDKSLQIKDLRKLLNRQPLRRTKSTSRNARLDLSALRTALEAIWIRMAQAS